MGNVEIKVVEKIKVHILYKVAFFPKIVSFMRKCRKFGGAGKAADGDTSARCMLG